MLVDRQPLPGLTLLGPLWGAVAAGRGPCPVAGASDCLEKARPALWRAPVGRVTRAICCFSHLPEDFFRGMFSMQMTKTVGPFVVFVKKKKKDAV